MSNTDSSLLKQLWLKAKPSLKVFGSVTWMLTKIGIVFAFAAVIGGVGMGTGMVVGALKDVPEFDQSILEHPFLPSYIYDVNGDLITEIHDSENRIPIKMTDVPPQLRYAFLAAEDNNFFRHSGFDLKGIARAVYNNIVEGTGEGASTITQQIVSQIYLSKEKKLSRKIQEVYIAVGIERQYTKEEIFEFYINNATFYDNNAYGVEAAAQTYFGKSASELTLAEGALLAGIPNSPAYFSPDPDDMEPALSRRNDVLARMRRFDYITEEEYQAALAEEIVLNMKESKGWPYPHYVDAVVHKYAIDALMSTGLYDSEDDAATAIRRDGLQIYTALDPRIQQVVQDVMFDDKYYPKDTFVYPEGHSREGRRYPQGAAVVMDAKTGYVYGMVGGREFNSTNKLNRYNSRFQPGSSIKPVLVYGPAFELGILSPASVLDDSPTAWPGLEREYTPENYAKTFKGLVTVRDAIIVSDNIPAIKAYEMVLKAGGGRYGADFAQGLGIDGYGERNKNNPKAYLQLGSAIGSQEVTPLEMTEAYSAYANKGMSSEPIFVTKIVDRNGDEIYTSSLSQTPACSEQTAFLMTNVLRDVVVNPYGTAKPSKLSDYNVAAKTGTTDDAHDRWTVGYSANYVFTVWMGNDNKEATVDGKTVYIPGTSAAGYMRINDMFGAIARGTIGENDVPFPQRPSGLTQVTVCKKSGLLPSANCPTTVTDWFKNSSVPTETCNLHVVYRVCTESGDLATEGCPEHLVEERVFLNRPEVEPTDDRWAGPEGRLPADYDLRPPTTYCLLHGITYNFEYAHGALVWDWSYTDSGFVGFNLYRTAFGETVKLNSGIVNIDTRSITVPSHAPGIKYEYQLVLVTSDGKEIQRHKPFSVTPPVDLIFIVNVKDEDSVKLDWVAPFMENTGVTLEGFKIFRNDAEIKRVSGGVTSYEDKDLSPGSYEYKIIPVYKFNGNEYDAQGNKETIVIEGGGTVDPPGDEPPGDEPPGDGSWNPTRFSVA